MSEAATLLFGVGATKSGTSWLYRYLHAHPECHLRSVKELHFFDSIDLNDAPRAIAALEKLRDYQIGRLPGDSDWQRRNIERQIAEADELIGVLLSADEGAYLRYLFAGFDASRHRLAADITPAYALLGRERLAGMAAMHPGARLLYLMRDPVERLWSHVRMQAVRQLAAGEEVAVKARRILNRLMRQGQEAHITARGDYRGTIARLVEAVPAARLMIEFAERLRSDEGIARLCAFLGISFRPAQVDAAEHEGARIAMSAEQRAEAAAFLAPQYRYVDEMFGPLPPEWRRGRDGV